MPEEDLPELEEMVHWANSIEPLSEESKETLVKMMEQLAEAHYQAGQAAPEHGGPGKNMQPSPNHDYIKICCETTGAARRCTERYGFGVNSQQKEEGPPRRNRGKGEHHIATQPRGRLA